jgi:hypothetical protein
MSATADPGGPGPGSTRAVEDSARDPDATVPGGTTPLTLP